jgi:hypothetical protein
MASFLESAYSLVHQDNAADLPSQQELKTQLEKGTDEVKVETMKRILTAMLNGDPMPGLLMHIIRFVMPSKSKPLKKLLYFYYEICPKLDANGKLKQEMILVWYVWANSRSTLSLKRTTAMASGMTSSIPTNSSVATLYDSFASLKNPNSSSHSFHPLDLVSNIDMHMLGKTLCGLLHSYTSIRKA